MDEEGGDFVEGMENHRVPPHSNCPSVVAVGKTVGTDEETPRIWEDPYRQEKEDVDKVAEIGEEVVVATLMVGIEADRHEIRHLDSVPPMHHTSINNEQKVLSVITISSIVAD